MEGFHPPQDRFLTGNRPAQSLSEFSVSEHLGVWQTADARIPDRMKETSSICQQQEEMGCSGAWGLALLLFLGMTLWSLMQPQVLSLSLSVFISLCAFFLHLSMSLRVLPWGTFVPVFLGLSISVSLYMCLYM